MAIPIARTILVLSPFALALAAGCAGRQSPQPVAPAPVSQPVAAEPTPPRVDVAQELALARAAHAGGRIDEEALHLDRALRADPGELEARVALAQILLGQGSDLDRAGRLLGEAGAIRPDDARLDRLHGLLDELRGDDEHAAFRYRRALAVDPDPELRFRRGILLRRLGRDEEALSELQRVASERPSDRAARGVMAEVYEALGRQADAEAALLQIARLAATEPGAWHRLAAFYRRHEQPAKAHDAEHRARSLEGAPRALRPLRPSSR